MRCANCSKSMWLSKKYRIYPGNKRGSFELTAPIILCRNCVPKFYNMEERIETFSEVASHMTEKKYREALEKLDNVFTEHSRSDWYTRGSILQNLKRHDEALKCFEEALFLDTHMTQAWYRKGVTLLELKRYEDAAKCFENVVSLEEDGKMRKRSLREDWYIPAIFCCMVSWVKKHNDLVFANNFSEEIYAEASEWINKFFYHSTEPILADVNEDETRLIMLKMQDLIRKPEKFVDFCVTNYSEVLDVMEPPIVAELVGMEK